MFQYMFVLTDVQLLFLLIPFTSKCTFAVLCLATLHCIYQVLPQCVTSQLTLNIPEFTIWAIQCRPGVSNTLPADQNWPASVQSGMRRAAKHLQRCLHLPGNHLLPYIPVKYDYVGKLLRPGEEPTEYTDDEEGKDKKTDQEMSPRGEKTKMP